MFRFESPLWLLLIPIGGLILLGLRSSGERGEGQEAVAPDHEVLDGIRHTFVERTRWLPGLCSGLAVVLLIVALARPQWGQVRTEVDTEGINIVLALDISESMSALDFRQGGKTVDRLTAVKAVVREFIRQRTGDRIGLVVFGSEAYTQAPLTRDVRALETVLDAVEIGAAGKSTAIGDAIGIALKRLEDVPSPSNIIVLLTDGRSNAGEIDPRTAADIAAARTVKIYTVGVGGREPAPFVIQDPIFGKRTVYQRVDIDEELLAEIARKTGAESYRAENLDTLKKIYDEIGTLETSTVRMRKYDDFHDRYLWALVPGIAGLCLAFLLGSRRYLEVP